jgi:signal transduction histidine kinase
VWFRISGRSIIKKGRFSGIRGVFVDVTDRKNAEEKINILLSEKEELIKEINCLYSLSKLMEETPDSLDEILHFAADILKEGCAWEEYAAADIVYNEKSYSSSGYVNPVISIENDIVINGTVKGYVSAGYITDKNETGIISFSEKDSLFLGNVAERISKIIELVQAREDLRKLEREIINISETERRNIGQELHDGLGQILTGVSFMIKNLKSQVNSNPEKSLEKLNEIGNQINDASIMCRQITRGTPLVNINHNTLLLALDQLAISTREIYGINCIVEGAEEFCITDDFVSLQLYRITQEAVTNAVKHSGCDSVTILLRGGSNIYLSVHDNGRGCDMKQNFTGMGLNIMRYRADLINGKFSAGNYEDGGFIVSVIVIL